MAEPNVANVFAGPTVLYLAAAGIAFPSMATLPTPTNWATANFLAVGYTDDGVEFITTPSVKDIIPDEVITPIMQIVTGIKVDIKANLLEVTIENLQRAMALSSLSNPGLGIKTLSIGSGNPLKEFALGFQGPSPGGATDRVIQVWRVNVTNALTQKYQRKDVAKLAVSFSALSDSTKAVGRDVFEVVDFNAGS